MPAGRPSKYPKGEALQALCEQILTLASEGKSLAQISARVDIPRSTMQSWAEEHAQFSATLTRAKELEQCWWEDQAQNGLTADRFNSAVWSKSVSARFKGEYTDRTALEHTSPDGTMSPQGNQQALDELTRRLDSIAKPSGSGEGS